MKKENIIKSYEKLLQNNKEWAAEELNKDAEYFQR
jgi:hypothetical protein